MSNMEIWDKVKKPPAEALKKIGAGRLKGMTDISPQWRVQIMTDTFGPCGIGWKYEVVDSKKGESPSGEVAIYVDVHLYIKYGEEWSAPIPGSGGSMLIKNETSGKVYLSDEAYKMAITDALSTAMKYLGVAADIYLGKWDGSKYKDDPEPLPEKPAQLTEGPMVNELRSCKTMEALGAYWKTLSKESRTVLEDVKNEMKAKLDVKS